MFLDENGLTSIIFEINEYVAKDERGSSLDDNQALLYHFRDVIPETNKDTQLRSLERVTIPSLP